MRNRPVVYVSALAVIVIAVAAWSQSPGPGADIRNPKTDREPLRKPIQSRICPFDATEFTGCDR